MFGNGCLLVGDSGSLVDPFTGEGIGNALLSSKIAIKHYKANMENFDLECGRIIKMKFGMYLEKN